MIVTKLAHVFNVVTFLATEGYAAYEVTAEPTANDTCAPLRACGLEAHPRQALLVALGALS